MLHFELPNIELPLMCLLQLSVLLQNAGTFGATRISAIVSIQRKSSTPNLHNHLCTGSLLSPDVVLTAAHCLVNPSTNKVKNISTLSIVAKLDKDNPLGPKLIKTANVSNVIVHSQYDHERGFNDICLLVLNQSIDLGAGSYLHLPQQSILAGNTAILAGWGTLYKHKIHHDRQLSFEQVIVLPHGKCKKSYTESYADGMLCAAKGTITDFRSPCTADAGSPLVDNNQCVVGLVTFGVACGLNSYPVVFTDVYYHIKWIRRMQKQIQQKEKHPNDVSYADDIAQSSSLAKHIVSIEHAEQPFMLFAQLCAGIIITDKAIITVASCLMDKTLPKLFEISALWVVAGTGNRKIASRGLQISAVQKVRIHHYYHYGELQNDIAMIILKQKIIEDNLYRQRIELPKHSTPLCVNATIYNWNNATENQPGSEELFPNNVRIVHPVECNEFRNFDEGMLCVKSDNRGGRSCLSHLGSPLIHSNVLFGMLALDYNCGSMNNASIYTEVWHYREWIRLNSSAICGTNIFIAFIVLLNVFI